MHSLIEIFKTGGLTLASIFLLALVAAFVLFERLIATAGVRERVRTTTDSLIKLLYQGELATARTQAAAMEPDVGALFTEALGRMAQNRPGVRETIERQRAQFNQGLRKGLWMLGTIAAASPFIGLFGTVVGIMQSFKDIAETGGGGFSVVSRGLSEALITTAAGIIVAVMAVVFYNFLQARLAKIAFVVRLSCEELAEVLLERRGAGGKEKHGDLGSTGT
ncbi:MAG: MotA/TolQ/ExbB proton channel family protein [Deltaproteobacteria bacterium]|nr:MotA/TolQ/ExbB proton channel family protein [Deltaproteobacteria bacterium]